MAQATDTDLGEIRELILNLERNLDKKIELLDKNLDKKIDLLDKKLDIFMARTEERFNAVDQRFNAVDQRFNAVEQRFSSLESSLNKRIDSIEQRSVVQETRFWSFVGILVTALLGILARFAFFPNNPT